MDLAPDHRIRFRFRSQGMSHNMFHYVVTRDMNHMQMFLKQHNFDPTQAYFDIVPIKEDDDEDEEYVLEPFMMKSNSSDKIYTIMSTEHFMLDCANSLASMLSSLLMFGLPHIIKDEIPIMRVISELISGLDFTYILDHTVCDPSTNKPYSSNYERYVKCGYLSATELTDAYLNDTMNEPCSYDDAELYDGITKSVSRDKIQPFTLEMYISYFASLLTDSYE